MKVSKITIGRLYNLGNYEHDPDYVAALFAMAAARLDATNAEVLAHMRTCQTCLTQPFGSCPTVLGIIANPPKINPQNN